MIAHAKVYDLHAVAPTNAGHKRSITLNFKGISKSFRAANAPVVALEHMDLAIPQGEFISVVGPSGCGKTTLLNVAAGLERVSSGSVTLDGNIINAPVTDIGIVFQDPNLMDWRTVLDNVLLQIEVRKRPLGKYREKAKRLLADFGLSNFIGAYPSQLSGGMRQRVSIVRALIHEPSLLLMDEPFSALDALTRDKLNVDLQQLCLSSGTTTLFVTHSISDAVLLGDRVVVMTPRPGRIAEVIDIEFPRPRPLAIREEPAFGAYSGRIRSIFERAGVL